MRVIGLLKGSKTAIRMLEEFLKETIFDFDATFEVYGILECSNNPVL
jgi:hypothetical protein